ncbi:MAG TPA: antibiotic biosynthesis monooxygenase [Cyclobacteriaceae bacterium]|nr:antibiotic biosynthesis monooxygenase [Cyclobacteriaceae bacterium]HRJ83053.1 antibiotic biosynthesis monooxygenase [Cyclobacteriaceae bacterium]
MKTIRFIIVVLLAQFVFHKTTAQESDQLVRMAKLVIDSTHLEAYKAFLKEEIETSLRVEPGVLTLYAVSEKERPNHITILEIYKDMNAYRYHVQTPHFLKYKNGTLHMVKSLDLIETEPLMPEVKLIQRD